MDSLHKHGSVGKQKCTVGIIITTQSFNACIHSLIGTFTFLDILRCCGCISCIQFGGGFLQILYPQFIQIYQATHGSQFCFSVRRIQIRKIFHGQFPVPQQIILGQRETHGRYFSNWEEIIPNGATAIIVNFPIDGCSQTGTINLFMPIKQIQ